MNSNQTTRRTFLRGTVAGAAGLASLPSWAAPIGANSDVRVAVIGFKSRGSGHIASLLKIKGVRLVALCDVDSAVLEKHVADLDKKGIKVKAYKDFRECCADPDIDAITIATPNHTHTLIGMTAIANGKHVYVEKPVSHNIWEGRKLVEASLVAAKKGLVVQHGMQRRSDLGWAAAMEYVKSGKIGKVTLSRGINYKARKSIGKIAAPISPDADGLLKPGTVTDASGKGLSGTIDYKLWSGPRGIIPVQRTQFHYDWHWQWAYGNGDIGNQGPHQLDVARWALGNPDQLPKRVMSFGGRWGYDDDGQTANNQMAFYEFNEGAPLLFDNRGLPMKDMNWTKGYEPVYRINGKTSAPRIGNVIHCEGGFIAEAKAYDNDGKAIEKFENFQDGPDHMKNFIDSVRAGKITKDVLNVAHGHHAAALAHMANVSYRLGKKISNDEIKERLTVNKAAQETFDHFVQNLVDNKIDMKAELASCGPMLEFDPVSEKFIGEFAEEANKLATEEYVAGFELPTIS
jgi:predicted dehydrogenase